MRLRWALVLVLALGCASKSQHDAFLEPQLKLTLPLMAYTDQPFEVIVRVLGDYPAEEVGVEILIEGLVVHRSVKDLTLSRVLRYRMEVTYNFYQQIVAEHGYRADPDDMYYWWRVPEAECGGLDCKWDGMVRFQVDVREAVPLEAGIWALGRYIARAHRQLRLECWNCIQNGGA